MAEKFIQYKGPFSVDTDILSEISDCIRCGIQAPIGTIVEVTSTANSANNNTVQFEIGKTGILEFYNCTITSIEFPSAQPIYHESFAYKYNEDGSFATEEINDITYYIITKANGIIDCTIET